MTTASVEPQATAPAPVKSAGGTDCSRRSRGETNGRTGAISSQPVTGVSATGPLACGATNPGGGPAPAAHAAKQQATKPKVESSDHAQRVVCIKQPFGRPRLAALERATVVTANKNLGKVRFGRPPRELANVLTIVGKQKTSSAKARVRRARGYRSSADVCWVHGTEEKTGVAYHLSALPICHSSSSTGAWRPKMVTRTLILPVSECSLSTVAS